MRKEDLVHSLREHKFPKKVVDAFGEVNRENFISEEYKSCAYEDQALPIGCGQTISQPYTVAFVLTLLGLEDRQRILEVGSGSGYVLALINKISKDSEIYGLERIKDLAESSQDVLNDFENILVLNRDGSKGLPLEAPFDRILVSATSSDIPQKLVSQLAIGGILVAPVRDSVVMVKRFRNENKIEEFRGFAFVPLVE